MRALLVENQNEDDPDYLGMALYCFTFSTLTGAREWTVYRLIVPEIDKLAEREG